MKLFLAKFLAMADELLAGQINPFAVVCDNPADHLRAPAVMFENGQDEIAILFGGKNTKTDPHVVDLMHLRAADIP